MDYRQIEGQAFRGGSLVADIIVTESREARLIEIPIPGSNSYGYKDASRTGPSTIQLLEIHDPVLRDELQRFADAAGDNDARRRLRDAQMRAISVDLSLDDGRQLVGAGIQWPAIGLPPLEQIAFPLHHADL